MRLSKSRLYTFFFTTIKKRFLECALELESFHVYAGDAPSRAVALYAGGGVMSLCFGV